MVANTKIGQSWTACKVFAPINTTGKVTKISNQSFIFISFQTFPRASLTEFIFMVLEALGKAAFHVKAEICQVFTIYEIVYNVQMPVVYSVHMPVAFILFPLTKLELKMLVNFRDWNLLDDDKFIA